MSSNTPFGDEPSAGGSAASPSGSGSAPTGGSAWSGAGADVLGSDVRGSGASAVGTPRGRAFVPWIIGLVVALVLGGSAVAVRAALGDEAGGPAEALPSSTLLFAQVDVDPEADQKVNALRLATRFPGFVESTGITDTNTDLRVSLFDAIKGRAPGVSDLDYAADVEPWLGSRLGVAVLAPDGDGSLPGVALAVEVTDQEAAAEGIAKLLSGADDDHETGVAFTGSYAVFALTQEAADGYVAAAEQSALTANEDFEQDMAALGAEGIASAWVSADAYDALGASAAGLGGMVPGVMGPAGTDLSTASVGEVEAGAPEIPFRTGSMAYTLRFEERYLEVAMVGHGSELAIASSDSESPIAQLPESTLAAFSVANGGQYVQQYLDRMATAAEQTGMNFEREINRFEKDTGLTVPEDFVTLLGDHFTLAVDSDLGNPDNPAELRVGALLDTDPGAAETILDKLVTAAGAGVELATVESDDLLAVGPSEAYASELAGGSLGETSEFDLAVAYGADSDVAFFLNLDRLETLELFADQAQADATAKVAPLQAVGFSVELTGDGASRGALRITVDE